ncbi:MAG: hypothetical protein OXF04_13105, partial [bacterium]|nr:hypothetical protein [bacterium]
HLLVWMGRNELGERVISDVSQIVNYDDRRDSIETHCLWSLRPGHRWATAVGRPQGQIEQLYRSVVVSSDGQGRTADGPAASSASAAVPR